jgi:hypothetical protein
MQELFSKHGIAKEDVPPFFHTWFNCSLLIACSHLSSYECGPLPIFVALLGILSAVYNMYQPWRWTIFKSLEALSRKVLEDEALTGLDDKARDKLIAHDKLKAEKVKNALEKSRLKEVEKKKK